MLLRLSGDWQLRYGHPVVLVETFVDPEHYCGTTYTVSGWKELGLTEGHGRVRRDFYTEHGRPKRLFAKELGRGVRRSLAAEVLKPSLAIVEAKVPPRPTQSSEEIRSIIGHFKNLPDYRARIGSYPLWSLLAIVFMAHLCGAPRGQKDLEKFAAGLSSAQRRAVGIRRQRDGSYPSPKQPTFCRLMAGMESEKLEQTILQIQRQIRGEPDPAELINIDGKEPKHGSGDALLTAVTSQSQFYLGSELVPTEKTNEIPIARALFEKLDLDGRIVSLDALHTQDKTARALVLEHGADYLMTVKDNQSTIHRRLERLIDEPSAIFSPQDPPVIGIKKSTGPCQYRSSNSREAASRQMNKGRDEIRTLRSSPMGAETADFPLVAQAARLLRITNGKRTDSVELLTSRPPEKLSALDWLKLNRQSWGIESGLHQRLDVSHLDDLSRVRKPRAMLFMGMFRRLSNSLCMHWISKQPRSHHQTTANFFSAMNASHHRYALRSLFAASPSFSTPS